MSVEPQYARFLCTSSTLKACGVHGAMPVELGSNAAVRGAVPVQLKSTPAALCCSGRSCCGFTEKPTCFHCKRQWPAVSFSPNQVRRHQMRRHTFRFINNRDVQGKRKHVYCQTCCPPQGPQFKKHCVCCGSYDLSDHQKNKPAPTRTCRACTERVSSSPT